MKFKEALKEGEMFVIGGRGMRQVDTSLEIFPNRTYWMGASTSPDWVMVTKVDEKWISYFHISGSQKDLKIEKNIGQDMIKTALETELKLYGSTVPDRAKYIKQLLKNKNPKVDLSTGKNKPVKKDFERVELHIVPKKGAKAKARGGDFWYDAEKYGGVGSKEEGGRTVYVVNSQRYIIDEIKKDKLFDIIKIEKDKYDYSKHF